MATIKEIQQRLELVTDLADPFLAEAANDQRSGVQKAILCFLISLPPNLFSKT